MLKLTSKFPESCSSAAPVTALHAVAKRLPRIGLLTLACVLPCVLLHHSPATTAWAQETASPPSQVATPDTTKPAAPAAPERIEIRIELPIVEPFFNIFYEREEPKIEADRITPVANPLQKLPPAAGEVPPERFRAQRLVKPQVLLDRQRE